MEVFTAGLRNMCRYLDYNALALSQCIATLLFISIASG